MPPLYLLTGEMARIAEALSEAEEVPDQLAQRLDLIEGELKHKVEGCCRIHAQLLADAEAYNHEAKRLLNHSKAAINRANWLKQYMQGCLEQAGIQRLDADLFKVRIQNNPPSVCIAPMDFRDLPPDYQRVTIDPDKKALLEAHKAGKELPPGVEIITTSSLRIS